MTDHDKKISGVEAPLNPEQQQAGPSEGRRRLVKGVIIGTPAILMVRGGYSRPLASLNLTSAEVRDRICTSLGAGTHGYRVTNTMLSFYPSATDPVANFKRDFGDNPCGFQ